MSLMQHIRPHDKDLGGGFTVRRLLPAIERQSIGPFLFFDHFGPATVAPESAHDVRPHPHIGLATVTYLFSGAIMHRDSLGCVQQIEPGAINWMTAGRGIVHSERRPPALAQTTYVNHGIQLWAALPADQEEAAPAFVHTPAQAIAQLQVDDATVRVLVGRAWGVESPVVSLAPALYLDVQLPAHGQLELPAALAEEVGIYAVDADVWLGDETLAAQTLAVLPTDRAVLLRAGTQPVRCMVIGGDALAERRHIWWNFVSSRKERIVQAASDWEAQRMGQVPGEAEFIPLPTHRFKP
jgi:redox-sensitive bicupin YhaK (pirin superfamily)